MSDRTAVLLPHVLSDDAAATLQAEFENRLPGLDVLVAATPDETRSYAATADIVATTKFPAELLDDAPELQWVQALSAGVDHYDLDRLQNAGIALTNASGVHAEPIAEQVFGYLLCFEREIHRGLRQQARGAWEQYTGGELRGKTLGVVGLGAIGTRVAEVGQVFGMTVLGTKRNPEDGGEAADEVYGSDDLHIVLAQSDYVVLACPLTEETRGLIGIEEFDVMKSDAVLVNIARGEVVDESALEIAVQKRHIGGAALDVFEEEPLPEDSPLWNLSNVIVTPHMAGWTPYYWERCADLFVENYQLFVDGRTDEFTNRIT